MINHSPQVVTTAFPKPPAAIAAFLPYKSVAGALIFSLLLGPLGLLYASFWGGLALILVGAAVACTGLLLPILMVWLIACIWSVGAVEFHNKKVAYQRLLRHLPDVASINQTAQII